MTLLVPLLHNYHFSLMVCKGLWRKTKTLIFCDDDFDDDDDADDDGYYCYYRY